MIQTSTIVSFALLQPPTLAQNVYQILIVPSALQQTMASREITATHALVLQMGSVTPVRVIPIATPAQMAMG